MPRHPRFHEAGSVVHCVSRFINGEFLIETANDRHQVLDRIARGLPRCDWQLVAYAVMSNHLHLAFVSGTTPLSRLMRPAHTAIAHWLNARHERRGPVFSERARMVSIPPERVAHLLAYIHNNPVRAGVARAASRSGWTSHRAFVGEIPAPPWLDVRRGLELAGFDATAEGRDSFDAFVRERSDDPRDDRLSARTLTTIRRRVRATIALPVELATPTLAVEPASDQAPLVHIGEFSALPRWPGPLEELVELVSRARGVSALEMRSRSKARNIVAARRVAVVTATRALRRNVNEIAAALGIASNTASSMLRDERPLHHEALRLGDELRATSEVTICDADGGRDEGGARRAHQGPTADAGDGLAASEPRL
ncbi:MAG: transposase [Myxococcales bacterium]|nr:transposase [Myxococcales bacterium]